MCVHAEGNSLVAVAQLLGYAGDIGTVCDGDTGKGVTQLVGMETRHIILLGELLHVSGWRLGVHRLRTVLLSEDIGTDGVARLFQPELLEQFNNFRVNINRPHLAALGRVQVNAFLRCVAEVSPNRNRSSFGVDVFPL